MAAHISLTVQPQAYPCGDLLDGGRRRDYLDIAVPFYRASIEGDLEAAKDILDDHPYLVRYAITEKKDTPLHVAAAGNSIDFVNYLVSKMSDVDMELKNGDGNTAFCMAAISGNVGMVEIMYMKNPALPTICGGENMTPLYLAAYHRNSDVVTFLYDKLDTTRGDVWTNDVMDGVLLKCIQADMFDIAIRIMADNIELPQDKHLWDVLQVLARKHGVFNLFKRFKAIQSILYDTSITSEYFTSGWPIIKKGRDATQLLRFLWKRIMQKPKEDVDKILRGPVLKEYNTETYPSQILFIAAKMNNCKFLLHLIREYPDLIWKKNDDGQTIFHVAVAYRHWDVYNLLYEIGSMKDLITPIVDNQGNNILHIAGKKPEQNEYKDWLTPTLQMDTESVWYKSVESMLPPPCRDVKNAAGKTPQQVFIESHAELNSDGIKWINKTINVSMVVAALVCTISFSVVYSIPGGFNQTTGFPIFLHKRYFNGFLQLDVASFVMSSTSITLFLFVILSRNHGNMKILVRTWVVAQMFLSMSVVFLVEAFCISFFLVYGETVWITLLNILALLITLSCTAFSMNAVEYALRAT